MGKLAYDMCNWLRLPLPNPNPNPNPNLDLNLNSQGQNTDTEDTNTMVTNQQAVTQDASKPHPQAIDLGLPSGTKWASCNVGATKPEVYGGYYAWGETEEKKIYNRKTYAHKGGFLKKSYRDLGGDIAGTQYDVAHVKWGKKWRMPTIDQIKELLKNCTDEWTEVNGVKGRKFTSKINGNSIFLPAAAQCYGTSLISPDSVGYYWSSKQDPSHAYEAYYLCFFRGCSDWYRTYRYFGQSVRPVTK